MPISDEAFKAALEGKQIPILTLDNKWQQLFEEYKPTYRIKRAEREITNLLKRQGKLTNDIKDAKKLRKKLMDEVVGMADEVEQGVQGAEKRLNVTKRLIDESKSKVEKCEKELEGLPDKIEAANNNLMLMTMDICYQKIKSNTAELAEISEWIAKIREELKEKAVHKKEMEISNNNLYQYMHQIFGAEVIEIFDMQNTPELMKKKEEKPEEPAPETGYGRFGYDHDGDDKEKTIE
jgi:predicted  nucleic acid-binding Zn-ribbon protein